MRTGASTPRLWLDLALGPCLSEAYHEGVPFHNVCNNVSVSCGSRRANRSLPSGTHQWHGHVTTGRVFEALGIAALSTAARPSEWRQAKVRLGHRRCFVAFVCTCPIASAAPPPILNIMCNMGTARSLDQPRLPSSLEIRSHCRHVPRQSATFLDLNAAQKLEMSNTPKAPHQYVAASLY